MIPRVFKDSAIRTRIEMSRPDPTHVHGAVQWAVFWSSMHKANNQSGRDPGRLDRRGSRMACRKS